jgi:low affinity Fe/Cu permease
MREMFRRTAEAAAIALGSAWLFVSNVLLVLGWVAVGPYFGFSDTWQLWMNTFTTVITYLAVFLIQNTQNRHSKATHLKLDELISSLEGARNQLVDLENMPDDELDRLEQQFRLVRKRTAHGEIGATRSLKGEPDCNVRES